MYMLCKKRHLSQPSDNAIFQEPTEDDAQYDADAPADFICPISQYDVRPVADHRLAGQEQNRPECAIAMAGSVRLRQAATGCDSNRVLTTKRLTPNLAVRRMISEWKEQHVM